MMSTCQRKQEALICTCHSQCQTLIAYFDNIIDLDYNMFDLSFANIMSLKLPTVEWVIMVQNVNKFSEK